MAIFGALNSLDSKTDEGMQDAVNAVKAAIEFNSGFTTLLDKWINQWGLYTPHKIDIGPGCGIHTGQALVGNLGTETRDQFTALGPHVNFAQRIESITPKGKIWISASTKLRIRENVKVKKVKTVSNIKNITGDFDIFEVQKVQKKK